MLLARRESRSGKRLFSRIAIAVGAPFLAVAVAVLLRPWLEPLSTAGFDLYQRLSPYTLAANPVIIVDIDDSSLARIGGRSWSPRVLAELLDRLREAGARVVGFDLRFAEPSRSGSSNGTSPALGDVPDAETRFAEAIARMPVVLGFDLVGARQGRGTVIAKAPIGFAGSTGGDPTRALYRFPEAVADRQPLQNAAAGIGFANTLADTDGKLRKAPLIATLGNRIVPSFAAEVVRVAQGTRLYLGRAGRHGMNGLLIGTQPVATDDYGVVWLRYGGSRPDRFIHAADVLSGNFDAGALAQRIVLVGVTAPSLGDR
jgi:adenylate cyclase